MAAVQIFCLSVEEQRVLEGSKLPFFAGNPPPDAGVEDTRIR
jgi:hypothetical protein